MFLKRVTCSSKGNLINHGELRLGYLLLLGGPLLNIGACIIIIRLDLFLVYEAWGRLFPSGVLRRGPFRFKNMSLEVPIQIGE